MQTLGLSFEQSGVGLHSGIITNVKVIPASPDQGRYFVRVDLPNCPIIPAHIDNVISTTLSTELSNGDAKVRTVEHLLAALAGMGVDNVRIEINGPEVPLLDGSALLWVEAIATVGIIKQKEYNQPQELSNVEPIWVQQGDAFVAALPAPSTRFTYGIDFDLAVIGNQWHSFGIEENFAKEIAPARTFGLEHQIEYLRQAGLIKGGSLDNALVCGQEGWLNPPLRFANEPVRHKLLDLVGDLSLLGFFPQRHFIAYKASHQMHIQLAKLLAKKI